MITAVGAVMPSAMDRSMPHAQIPVPSGCVMRSRMAQILLNRV